MVYLLIADNPAMASALTDVATALLLCLTVPVTVADVAQKRSFSKLRLLETDVPSNLTQRERLHELVWLCTGRRS
jgi:hypothetical protein